MPEARKTQDGFDTLLGGSNNGLNPLLLQPNQYALGVNTSARTGIIGNRPDLIDFDDLLAEGVEIPDGKFQGGARYSLNSSERITFGVSGHVYTLNVATGVIKDWGLLLDPDVDRFYFLKAERFMIVQDGKVESKWEDMNWPVIIADDTLWDQSDLQENSPKIAFPKGSIMAYGHGRIFVAVNYIPSNDFNYNYGRVQFLASNIVKADDPDAILKFEETQYYNGGGAIKMANELGFIYAMKFQRNAQSGTGLGPLIVFAENGSSSFAVDTPRSQWQDNDIGKVLFEGTGGTLSTFSAASVNNDILYYAKDGIRTFRYSSTIASGQSASLNNDPISYEMSEITRQNDFDTMDKISGNFLNNRYLVTSVPDTVNGETVFKALVSLDTSVVSSLESTLQPLYDGIWTGLDFLQVLSAKLGNQDREFVFAKKDGKNKLYYIDETRTETAMLSRIYTRGYTFQTPFDIKELRYVELWLQDIVGDVEMVIYYRPDGYQPWSSTISGSIRASASGLAQHRRKVRFTVPSHLCELTGRKSSTSNGTSFQFCIQWKGFAKISKARFVIDDNFMDYYDLICDLDNKNPEALNANEDQIILDDFEYELTA